MKALIIEDEPHILEDLIEILVSTEAFEEVLSANSKKAAIRILANDAIKLNPIFVTLDLNLCGSRNDGIELLEHFPKGSVVLVYTGMGREYAMDIMNHPHALHLSSKYWEKGERTRRELQNDILEFLRLWQNASPLGYREIQLPIRGGTPILIWQHHFLYAEANERYTIVYTDNQQYDCSLNITELAKLFAFPPVKRVSRSYVANLDHFQRNGEALILNNHQNYNHIVPRNGIIPWSKIYCS